MAAGITNAKVRPAGMIQICWMPKRLVVISKTSAKSNTTLVLKGYLVRRSDLFWNILNLFGSMNVTKYTNAMCISALYSIFCPIYSRTAMTIQNHVPLHAKRIMYWFSLDRLWGMLPDLARPSNPAKPVHQSFQKWYYITLINLFFIAAKTGKHPYRHLNARNRYDTATLQGFRVIDGSETHQWHSELQVT